jgi:IS30 family transposase
MSTRKYRRLNLSEREEISRMLAVGQSLRHIALLLERSASAISREVSRASMNRWTYRAARSQRRAERNARRRRSGKRKLRLNPRLWRYIRRKLKLRWSPEQIARNLEKEYHSDKTMRISHEAIYTYLYVYPRGELKKQMLKMLRRERKRRHRRDAVVVERKLEDMTSIEERPAEVAARVVPGHWEGDLLLGKNRQSSLGTLVERTTRFTLLVPLRNRTAEEVRKRFARRMKKLPSHMKLSLTYDQGREMAAHKLFTKDTEVKVYFAHPASPWERATNENTNGLIRQFFPKGTDFNKVSPYEVKKVQDMLNGRPRETLEWETPFESFAECVALNP